MPLPLTLRPLLVVILAGTLAAQTTWIVDAGGGGMFSDIPAAIQVAQSGDIIVVRPGSYSPFTVNKGLRILGDPGSNVAPQGATRAVATITNIARSEIVVLRGLTFPGPAFPVFTARISVTRCNGAVHLEGLALVNTSLTISDSVDVTALSVTTKAGGIDIDGSNAALTRCSIQQVSPGNVGIPGLLCTNSTVSWAAGVILGSNTQGSPPGPALRCDGGEVEVVGAASVLSAGFAIFSQVPAAAVAVTAGRVTIDPSVLLQPTQGGPAFTGNVVFAPRAWLDANVINTTLLTTLHAPANAAAALVFALPAAPVTTPFGQLWFAGPNIVLAVGTVPSTAAWSNPIALPANLPAGVVGVLQGGFAAAGAIRLSTPIALTLR